MEGEHKPTADVDVGDALLSAVKNGDKTEVEKLLEGGADPNAYILKFDSTPLREAGRTGNSEIAQLLLEKGADVNKGNSEDWTALMEASLSGHYNVVDILLKHGATTDLQDNTGWSALMEAVFKARDDIALRLIEAGATSHIQDNNRTSALLLAIANKEQEKLVDVFLDCKPQPQLDRQDGKGETALILACKMKNLKFVEKLLSMGANPDIANNDEDTALLIATESGEREIVEELLKNKANPNLGPEPPLLVANENGFDDIAELLEQYGAKTD